MVACKRCQEYREELAHLRGELRAERDRYDRLVSQVMDLKREGFTPPAAVGDIPQPEPLPEVVKAAIQARSERGTPEERQLTTTARTLLLRGDDPQGIAQGILAGEEAVW